MQTAQPLNAEIVRKKCNKPDVSLTGYTVLFSRFASEVERELQGYHSTIVKCSMSSQAYKTLAAADQGEGPLVFNATLGQLHFWIAADKNLNTLLCEICLGGTGLSPTDLDEARPPSNFEKSLRNTVFNSVARSFASAALAVRAAGLTLIKSESENIASIENVPEKCVAVNLLINAFTLSATIVVYFRQDEFTKQFLRSAEMLPDEATSLSGVMDTSPFGLEVFLAPTKMPLENIMNIKVGDVVPLGVRASTPVHVLCQGVPVTYATLVLREDSIDLKLLPQDALAS